MTRKKVGVRIPRQARGDSLPPSEAFSFELESLGAVADIVEIAADTPAEFIAGAKSFDGIITSWGLRIDRQIIESLEKCVVIGVGSVGTDMVDVDAATAAGIVVTNVPDIFIEEVADHAMMLILAVARRTRMASDMVRDNRWYDARPALTRVPRLFGQTLGLYAFGNVGRCLVRRAQAFGMRAIACDPFVSELEITAAGVEPVGFEELLARSDYLSIHAPLNDETRHAFDHRAFSRMKSGAAIFNTSRGGIIDEEALAGAIASGHLAGAGLDVLELEPPASDNPLLKLESVVITPHVASASTRMRPETRRRVGREVAMVLRGKWPMSCVNPAVLPRVSLERWQPVSMSRGLVR